MIDGAPGSLNTLNELAAAINDDSSYATTLTTALATKAVLTGSTNNTIATVTGANALQGEANLTFDGSKLTVKGDNGLVVQTATAPSSDTDPVGEIFFTNSSNDNVNTKIVTFRNSGTSGGDLAFFTRTQGDASNTEGLERLRITSGGDVLLGTNHATIGANTSDGSDNKVWSLCGGGDASQGRGAVITLYGNEAALNSDYGILSLKSGNTSTGRVEFYTQNLERFRIRPNGNLVQMRDESVFKTNSSGYYHFIQGGDTYPGGCIRFAGGSGDGDLRFYSQSTTQTLAERVRIAVDGKIGINTTSPSRTVTINGTINIQSGERIESTSSAGNLLIQGGSTYPGGHIKMWGGQSDDMITFNTSGSATASIERVRIESDGNIRWWPDGSSGVNLHATSGTSGIVLTAKKDGSVGTSWHFKNQNSSGQAQTWMEIDDNQRMHIPYSYSGTDKLNIYTGADAGSKGLTFIGQDGNNQNSDAGVIRFNGYGQTNGPWIFGKNVLSWGKKDLIFGTKSTTNDYSTELAESMRLTKYGELQLPYGSNGGANINYIEAAEFKAKYEGTTWMPGTGDKFRFATRINSNSSFITLTGSNDERITFSRACHVLFTMSQDVIGTNATESTYWYVKVNVNGSTKSYHLIRQTQAWDQMTFQTHLQIPANGYIELQCYFSGMTSLNIDWGSYAVVAWQH